MPVDSGLKVVMMLEINKQLRADCLHLSFLYGFRCHNHLKQGPLDSYLKNKTQETDLERAMVRNGSSDELKTQLLDELKPLLQQVVKGGVYAERLINTVLPINRSAVKGNKKLSHMVRTFFSSFTLPDEYLCLAFV